MNKVHSCFKVKLPQSQPFPVFRVVGLALFNLKFNYTQKTNLWDDFRPQVGYMLSFWKSYAALFIGIDH